jgi:ribonuclease HI
VTSPSSDDSKTLWTAYCDGASRGNPGPASFGVVVCDPAGTITAELAVPIGVNTNQVAEYEALIRALAELKGLGARRVKIFTDSEFVTKQVNGQYRAKDERMKALLARVRAAAPAFDEFSVVHIRRSSHPHNVRADGLANEALDRAPGRDS